MMPVTRNLLLLATLAVASPAPAVWGDSEHTMCEDPPCTRKELETYEHRASKHSLRVMNLRWEATNRGETKQVDRYQREFDRAEARRQAARRAIAALSE